MPHRSRLCVAALALGVALTGAASDGWGQPASPRAPARRPSRPAAGAEPWWWNDPRVVRRVDRDAAPRTVLAGDTVALPVPTLPAALPDSLRRRGVRWSTEDVAVATVDTSGRVVAVGIGETVVHAWTVAGETRTRLTVRGAVRGRVRDADAAPVAASASPCARYPPARPPVWPTRRAPAPTAPSASPSPPTPIRAGAGR